MSSAKCDYAQMVHTFMHQGMPVQEFVTRYLTKFKVETRALDEETFRILDEIFADVDAYTPDETLIAENPDFYINEYQLRKSMAIQLEKLKA